MNTTTCHAESALSAHPVAQLWQAIAARWAAHLESARKAHEYDFVGDLSADTLRDIGAPEHLISQAAGRRESQQQHLLELRQWRGG
ncbi:MAG TPA: hypothetical protein VHQ87_04750 [Rhizobacter sp.]|nr:hypothetical protein [Rhizobacter sp.]